MQIYHNVLSQELIQDCWKEVECLSNQKVWSSSSTTWGEGTMQGVTGSTLITKVPTTTENKIIEIASSIVKSKSCLYLGRGPLFPLALEGALKLKEVSYIHAEGFSAGEMKHGPIALIEEGLPVISLLANDQHSVKTVSNLREALARGAKLIIFADEGAENNIDFAHEILRLPFLHESISPIIISIPIQLLAYHTAVAKGTDVDQPKNLAKSVTVE